MLCACLSVCVVCPFLLSKERLQFAAQLGLPFDQTHRGLDLAGRLATSVSRRLPHRLVLVAALSVLSPHAWRLFGYGGSFGFGVGGTHGGAQGRGRQWVSIGRCSLQPVCGRHSGERCCHGSYDGVLGPEVIKVIYFI